MIKIHGKKRSADKATLLTSKVVNQWEINVPIRKKASRPCPLFKMEGMDLSVHLLEPIDPDPLPVQYNISIQGVK